MLQLREVIFRSCLISIFRDVHLVNQALPLDGKDPEDPKSKTG